MKKILSVLLSMVLVFGYTTMVFASDNGQVPVQKVTISEYQMIVNQEKTINNEIKKLQAEKFKNNDVTEYDKKLDELFQKMNAVKEEYKKLDEHIRSLKNRSKEDLEKFGYTSQQIEAIQNYDGSQEMMALASASLSIYAYITSFYRNTSDYYTYLQIGYVWSWSGLPNYWYTDCITAIWNKSYTNYANTNRITYTNFNDVNTTTFYDNVNLNSPDRMDFKFPMKNNQGYFANYGTGSIYLKQLDYNNFYHDINFKISYGHEYVSLVFEAGFDFFNGEFGIDITPKFHTDEITSGWYYWTRSY